MPTVQGKPHAPPTQTAITGVGYPSGRKPKGWQATRQGTTCRYVALRPNMHSGETRGAEKKKTHTHTPKPAMIEKDRHTLAGVPTHAQTHKQPRPRHTLEPRSRGPPPPHRLHMEVCGRVGGGGGPSRENYLPHDALLTEGTVSKGGGGRGRGVGVGPQRQGTQDNTGGKTTKREAKWYGK